MHDPACVFSLCAVNQTASAIPKTWMKPNEGISAGEVPQKTDEVGDRKQDAEARQEII